MNRPDAGRAGRDAERLADQRLASSAASGPSGSRSAPGSASARANSGGASAPIGRVDEHEQDPGHAPRDREQQRPRARVGPVDVLEHDDARRGCRGARRSGGSTRSRIASARTSASRPATQRLTASARSGRIASRSGARSSRAGSSPSRASTAASTAARSVPSTSSSSSKRPTPDVVRGRSLDRVGLADVVSDGGRRLGDEVGDELGLADARLALDHDARRRCPFVTNRSTRSLRAAHSAALPTSRPGRRPDAPRAAMPIARGLRLDPERLDPAGLALHVGGRRAS